MPSLMNIISKFAATTPSSNSSARLSEPPSPALSPTTKTSAASQQHSFTSAILSVPGTMDTSTLGLSESHLRRQALECLVTVLRSLVAWGTAAGKVNEESLLAATRSSQDERREPATPEARTERLSMTYPPEVVRQPTPDVLDDPARFETAKQKKTTLLEGIKKFNFKPKRVSAINLFGSI